MDGKGKGPPKGVGIEEKKVKFGTVGNVKKKTKLTSFALPSPFCLFGKNVIGIEGK